MIRALLLLLLIGTAFGQSVFIKDPATADSLGAGAAYLNTTGATFTRGTSAYNPATDTIVGPDVRRTRAEVIGTTSYNLDLIEGTRTNLLVSGSSSRFELWTAVAGGTTAADTVAAPDGEVIGQTLTDPGASLSGVSQTFTVTNDSLAHTFSIYVLKTAGGTAPTWGTTMALTGGTPVTTNSRINTDLGTQQYGSNANTTIEIPTNTAWYRIITTVTNNTSGNTTLTLTLYPAAAAYGASVDDAAATGSEKVAFADLNKAAFASSFESNRNLLLQTQVLNTTWTKTRTTITTDSTANPVDGAVNADTIVDDATAGSTHFITQSFTKAASAIQFTYSTYMKQSGHTWCLIQAADSAAGTGNGIGTYFDVANGVKGTTVTVGSGWTLDGSAITAVGSWYRVSITFTTASATTLACQVYGATADNGKTYNGTSAASLICWGNQLVYGATIQNYWANTTAIGLRASDALLSTLTNTDARTNRLTYSEQWDNAAWTKTDVTVTANATTDPQGNVYADTLTEGVAGTATTTQAATITAGQSVSLSGYFKRQALVTWIRLGAANGSDGIYGWYQIFPTTSAAGGSTAVTGTGSGASETFTNLGNGWYRCTLSGIVNAGSTAITYSIQSADADLSNTRVASAAYYSFGAQFEQAASAGTYLPVAGTAISAAQTGLSTTSGTLVGLVKPYGPTWGYADPNSNRILRTGAAGSDAILLGSYASLTNARIDSGATRAVSTVAQSGGTAELRTFSLTWDSSALREYQNGGTVGTPATTLAAPWSAATAIHIGDSGSSSQYIFGWIGVFYADKNSWPPSSQQIFANGVTAWTP